MACERCKQVHCVTVELLELFEIKLVGRFERERVRDERSRALRGWLPLGRVILAARVLG